MSIKSNNSDSKKREEAVGQKKQQVNPAVEKVKEDTKNKVRDIQYK